MEPPEGVKSHYRRRVPLLPSWARGLQVVFEYLKGLSKGKDHFGFIARRTSVVEKSLLSHGDSATLSFKFNEEAVEAVRRERDECIAHARDDSFPPGPNPLGLGIQKTIGDGEGVRSHGVLQSPKDGEKPTLLCVLGDPHRKGRSTITAEAPGGECAKGAFCHGCHGSAAIVDTFIVRKCHQ